MAAPIRTSVAAAVLVLTAAGPALAVSPTAPEPVDLGGAPIPGGDASTDPGNPTELEAGLWADTLAGGDPAHQFTYTRTIEFSTVHLAVVGAPVDPDGDGIGIEVFEAGGESCGSDDATTGYPDSLSLIGPAVDVGPSEPGTRDEACLRSETLTFTVGRGSSSASTSDLPIAIKVVEEAPSDAGAADLPTPAPSALAQQPDGGAEEQLDGAASFDDAPEIEGGTSYAFDLVEGQQRLFKVRLAWGQSLDAQVDVAAQPEGLEEQLAYSSPGVVLGFVDPMRNPFKKLIDDAQDGSYATEPDPAIDGVPPVRYLNRFEEPVASLPGDYWVTVTAQPADDREPVEIPVSLTVQVRGEVEGAPSYPDTVQGPGGSAGPDGYAADTPFLVGDGAFSADPSGNPPPSAGDDGGGDGFGPRRIGGAALLVVSLGLCAAGALRLRRRPV